MNSKRAKALRKVAKQFKKMGLYDDNVTERAIYKHIKKADKKLNTPTKEIFSADKIKATMS